MNNFLTDRINQFFYMTSNEIIYLIPDNAYLIISIPFIIGIIRRQFLQKETLIIFYFIINGILFEIISRTMTYFHIKNNLPFFHIYTIIEFFIISWFYWLIFKNYFPKLLIPIIFFAFFIFSLIDSFVFHNVFTFNSYAKSLECIIIVVLSVSYLYKTFNEFQEKDPSDTPVFWINAGFLFYFSGCLFLFTFSNYILTQGRTIAIVTWALHAFFAILMYILIAVGLWKLPHNR
jgi:VanZ family protein